MNMKTQTMSIQEEMIGKDVIDESGDKVGTVKDVEWDPQTKQVQYILLAEGGISAKLGLGDKKLIPIDMVDEVGDKILIKGILFKPE